MNGLKRKTGTNQNKLMWDLLSTADVYTPKADFTPLVSISTVVFEEGMLQENTITNNAKQWLLVQEEEEKCRETEGKQLKENNVNRNDTKTSFNTYLTEISNRKEFWLILFRQL